MIGEICAEIKNYFVLDGDRMVDDLTIENGVFTPSFDFPTDYIRIVGSRKNDGVYKVSDLSKTPSPLRDETFHGGVWFMSVPADFLALVAEIEAWQAENGGANSVAMSPFASESFGGYSYSKGSGASGASGASSVPTWQSTYASRLKQYRKVRVL